MQPVGGRMFIRQHVSPSIGSGSLIISKCIEYLQKCCTFRNANPLVIMFIRQHVSISIGPFQGL